MFRIDRATGKLASPVPEAGGRRSPPATRPGGRAPFGGAPPVLERAQEALMQQLLTETTPGFGSSR